MTTIFQISGVKCKPARWIYTKTTKIGIANTNLIHPAKNTLFFRRINLVSMAVVAVKKAQPSDRKSHFICGKILR